MRVFRLCSLWFDNANEEFVSKMIKVGFLAADFELLVGSSKGRCVMCCRVRLLSPSA